MAATCICGVTMFTAADAKQHMIDHPEWKLVSPVWIYDDGGRQAAGYQGYASDCVVRAIAIATELPYQEVYEGINDAAHGERHGKRKKGLSHARTGVYKQTYRKYMERLGWTWTPTMAIGSGCTVHLKADELPPGRLIVSVSGHLVAMIDGVAHDTSDPTRDGKRCVYGWFRKETL